MFKLIVVALSLIWIVAIESNLHINPLTATNFIAEILNFDYRDLSTASFDEVHLAILTYKVIVIRNQSSISIESLRSFMKRFGKLQAHVVRFPLWAIGIISLFYVLISYRNHLLIIPDTLTSILCLILQIIALETL